MHSNSVLPVLRSGTSAVGGANRLPRGPFLETPPKNGVINIPSSYPLGCKRHGSVCRHSPARTEFYKKFMFLFATSPSNSLYFLRNSPNPPYSPLKFTRFSEFPPNHLPNPREFPFMCINLHPFPLQTPKSDEKIFLAFST